VKAVRLKSSGQASVYTHNPIYIHVDGACCVCGALPYSLEWTSRPQADKAIERGRVCRTKGGERGGIERLVPVDCCPANLLFLFECPKPQHVCQHTAPPLSTTSCCWPRPNLGARVDRVLLAACQHSHAFNLLSDDWQ